MFRGALVLLASVVSLELTLCDLDPCVGFRCDTGACPCGCECGNATDPGVCYVPKHSKPLGNCDERRAARVVLVTGATGRTGVLLYRLLASDPDTIVRAFVRSVDKARKELGCKRCDESEGVFVGNITNATALQSAARGATAVAIAVGVSGSESGAVEREVEFVGVQNTVAALAQPANLAAHEIGTLKVVLCSSMGTTTPSPSPMASVLFWKLNAEAFIGASGLPYAIVKPCGLTSGAANQSTLLVGKDDTLLNTDPPIVSRADVAVVMHAALRSTAVPVLRFDLCSKHGAPPSSLEALLERAAYPWQ